MDQYNPKKIEKKWQRIWDKAEIYRAKNFSKKTKSYILVEFPYPSGEGLHIGHCRPYIAMDILSRKKRMENFNVLFPMGWDAFGLPTENYSVKTGIHPKVATRKNTLFFKRQQKSIGLSFDWNREINTTNPAYYKWTQWIFLQLFKEGLAYKSKIPINWCTSCKIGLANEEVVDGFCERCGSKVVKKEKEQWLLKITNYADRLIKDLDKVDYPEKVKTLQKDWIGKSEGFEINFPILNKDLAISVFTTRVDTLFGATYLVLAPEHPLIKKIKPQITNYRSIERYIEKTKNKTEKERAGEVKEKTGIELKGVKAINPANNREISIWIADYVLFHYGAGAIMAVPAHDNRDWYFAKKYNLPIVNVIKPPKDGLEDFVAYEGEGVLINSGRFDGMKSETAKERIGSWLERKSFAKKTVHYKLRDWIFSRQRYWGEPIPLIFCQKCGWVAVPEKNLPVELPRIKDYKPTEKGDSPLAKIEKWVNTFCPNCGGPGQRETDVMPNWAGSNWYYLAYLMQENYNFDFPITKYKKVFKYWMPVDWYNGGMEHSTLHLLYSRFIYKFLWDIKAVPESLGSEPYKKRTSHGMILGEKGVKMSKSRGNVITPEEIIEQYGADTLRVYEMFMGPFSEAIAWNTKGVKGAKRFLDKVWQMINEKHCFEAEKDEKLENILHKTIKKVTDDIEALRFNTAVSSLMILVNRMDEKKRLSIDVCKSLIKLLAPFAPHLTEELWQILGSKQSVHVQPWPKYDTGLIEEKTFILIMQVNGKVRDKTEVGVGISKEEAEKLAMSSQKIVKWTKGKKIRKIIFVPEKLINIVV